MFDINNLKIKSKLLLLMFFPVAIILIIAIDETYTSFKHITDANSAKKIIILSNSISNLVHETQKERGLSAGFIGSNGSKFSSELNTQRSLTTQKFEEFKSYIKDNINDSELKNDVEKVVYDFNQIQNIRTNIDNLNTNINDALDFYTNLNTHILNLIEKATALSNNGEISSDIIAYLNFLLYKEKIGLERAVGTNILSDNKASQDLKIKFVSLISQQKILKNLFLNLSDTKIQNFFKNILLESDVNEVKKIEDIIINNSTNFNIEPSLWFEKISNNINKLKTTDDFIQNYLVEKNENTLSSAYTKLSILVILLLIVILFILFISRLITLNIIGNIEAFKNGLNSFFLYALREKSSIEFMQVKGKDEFAIMTKEMNESITKIRAIIEQDKNVVKEIDDIMQKVSNGFFMYSVKTKGATNEVEALRQSINKMLNDSKRKFDSINKLLDHYASGDYSFKLPTNELDGMGGDVSSLYVSSILLGSGISELIAMIYNAGTALEKNTNILSSSSSNLSQSSSVQASSLEETASSIEHITENIKNNSSNVNNMSNYAKELTLSSQEGEKLATNTQTAMDEINSKVIAISEAINIIDKIAFQTNILSLNAAVEAATAGEAGRGFAVVAAEVRSLASRSADAAKDIKELVEDASNKTSNGEKIASSMIKGYTNLTQIIEKTQDSINLVATASKEQETRIIQINNAINELDKITQQNSVEADNIDKLTLEVSTLAKDLLKATTSASIDKSNHDKVCDVELLKSINGYKNDHINFKDTNYAKLDSNTTWQVTDCNSCKLGTWINECERENKTFTKTNTWKDLKIAHEKVHKGVQSYINENVNKLNGEKLRYISDDIEIGTYGVFDTLDRVLIENCKATTKS